jgi:hypothetical protein
MKRDSLLAFPTGDLAVTKGSPASISGRCPGDKEEEQHYDGYKHRQDGSRVVSRVIHKRADSSVESVGERCCRAMSGEDGSQSLRQKVLLRVLS